MAQILTDSSETQLQLEKFFKKLLMRLNLNRLPVDQSIHLELRQILEICMLGDLILKVSLVSVTMKTEMSHVKYSH